MQRYTEKPITMIKQEGEGPGGKDSRFKDSKFIPYKKTVYNNKFTITTW